MSSSTMLVYTGFTPEENNLMNSFIRAVQRHRSRPRTIADKLDKLAEEISLSVSQNHEENQNNPSESEDKHEENQVTPRVSSESVIPLFLQQEYHNYLIIDSFDVFVKQEKGIELLWSFKNSDNVVDMETYKKWFDHLNDRFWPCDVGEMLLEFSGSSVNVCHDGYTIVELRNIKYTDDENFNSLLNRLIGFDANPQKQILSKFLLVKVETEVEKIRRTYAEGHVCPAQKCFDPKLLDAHVESIFIWKNENDSTNSSHSEKNAVCQMGIFLAARYFPKNRIINYSNGVKILETFFIKCIGKAEENCITFSKVLTVGKRPAGNFCISQEDALSESKEKDFAEVGDRNDVDKMIHAIYHKCLERSNQIMLLHRFDCREFYEIFDITFKKSTRNLSSEMNITSLEEILKKRREENSNASLIHVSHLEVPEKTLQTKGLVSGESEKSRGLAFENVYGWFEAKEKRDLKLRIGFDHLLNSNSKNRKNILLVSMETLVKEIKRIKRLAEEEEAQAVQDNKRRRTETMNLDEQIDNSMEVDEIPSSDNRSAANPCRYDNNSSCGVSGQSNFQANIGVSSHLSEEENVQCEAEVEIVQCKPEVGDVRMLGNPWPSFIPDPADIVIDFKKDQNRKKRPNRPKILDTHLYDEGPPLRAHEDKWA